MKSKFPIVQEGGTLCEFCGRFYSQEMGINAYFCEACRLYVMCCNGCYSGRASRHIEIKHDRDNHWPLYSIDIV